MDWSWVVGDGEVAGQTKASEEGWKDSVYKQSQA